MANDNYSFLERHKYTIFGSGMLKKYQIVYAWTGRKEAYGKNSIGFISRGQEQKEDYFMHPAENYYTGVPMTPEVIFYCEESGFYRYDWVKANPENTTDYQTSQVFLTLSDAIEHFMKKD